MLRTRLTKSNAVLAAVRQAVRYNSTESTSASASAFIPQPRNNTVLDKFPPLESIKPEMLPNMHTSQTGWYYVPRSRGGKLPVYSLVKKSDGTVHTEIKHVEGDIHKLRQELLDFFGLAKHRIVIKQASGTIVIKHNVVHEVRSYLKAQDL